MAKNKANVESRASEGSATALPEVSESKMKRRLVIGVILVAAAVIGWFVGSTIVPRWWARRVGDVVDGSLTYGTFLGIAVGAAFVILPMLALKAGWKLRTGWQRWLKFVVLALILASPNLATLGIVFGKKSAAHAGERILDVDGPGFRGGSLVGAILGFLLVVGVSLLVASRRRNKAKVAGLKAELANATSD
jgi:hypothetical protein